MNHSLCDIEPDLHGPITGLSVGTIKADPGRMSIVCNFNQKAADSNNETTGIIEHKNKAHVSLYNSFIKNLVRKFRKISFWFRKRFRLS